MADRNDYEVSIVDDNLDTDLEAVNKKIEDSLIKSGKKSQMIAINNLNVLMGIQTNITENHLKENDKQSKDDEEKANKGLKLASQLGSAMLAVGQSTISSAVNMDQAMNQYIASTGKSASETERYQNVLESIYKDNYGESFEDIAQSMAVVNQQMGDMSDAQLKSVTESAYVLRDTFGYDMLDATQAAKSMMDNFGVSGEAAMELIAAGARNGLDSSGELLGSISEYSGQFAQVGLSADDMFKLFSEGIESGTYSLDTIGNAVQEFSQRAVDGSAATLEGFSALGLNADEMAEKFAAGGDTAKEAFQQTMEALASMEDPIAQNAAGVDLFGESWESLGGEALNALAGISDGAYDTGEAMNQLKEIKYDDLGSMFEALQRQVELLLMPLGEQLIPVLGSLMEAVMPIIETVLPVLVDGVGQLISGLSPIIEGLLPQFKDLMDQIVPILAQIIEGILPVIITLFSALLPQIMELISAILPVLLELINSILPVITAIVDILAPLIELIVGMISPIIDLIFTAIQPLIDVFFKLISSIFKPFIPIIKEVASVLTGALGDAVEFLKPIIEGLMETFSGVIEFIGGVFAGKWDQAWNSVVDIFRGIFNLIPSIVEGIINGAINIINGLIGGINKLTGLIGIPAIPRIPSVSIPRLKIGLDYVPSDNFPALLHEGEAVLTKEENFRLRQLGRIPGLEASILRIEQSFGNKHNGSEMDYGRIYEAVKRGAENAQLVGYFDPRIAGKVIAPTVNRELSNVSGQNRRYAK